MKKILITSVCIANYFSANAQIFHENFEIADSVIATSNNPASNWGISNKLHFSGTSCDSANLTNCDTLILTTLPFSTVGYSGITLTFMNICKTHFFDIARIEASSDGGLTWTKLCSEYAGAAAFQMQQCQFSSASYPDWLPAQPAFPPNNFWWKLETFYVGTLLGNVPDARIRFVHIDADCNATVSLGGWFIDDINITGTTGIEDFGSPSPGFGLFPNPAVGKVNMDFSLEKNADVKIEVFNSFAQKLKTVLNGKLKSGKQEIVFDSGEFPGGVYFVMMAVDGEMTMRKLVKM